MPLGIDPTTEDEYALQSSLLQDFTNISSIDKAWIKPGTGNSSQAMFSFSQPDLLANKMRKFILSSHISKESSSSANFQWAPFPVEMVGVSVIVPSPSASKLLVVRNPENDSPCKFDIWGAAQVEKEFHIPPSVHGSVYADGWFQGISWNSDETLIAYVAEEPSPSKPTFTCQGYKKGSSTDKDYGNWKGQGDWMEEWGETYAGKMQPALFVLNVSSGETLAVKGIEKRLSAGQVVWAPPINGSHQYLVFVGWSVDNRKLGIKYCYNRPCALYAVRAPIFGSEDDEPETKDSSTEDFPMVNLTQSISSAYYPQFSPDGKLLLLLSARSSVDSGAHSATDSLHKINWPADGLPCSTSKVVDVKWRASQEHRLSVPEPKGAWPVFGHLHLLGGSTPPQIILGAMADEYGPLFTIRLGVYPTLVLSSAELAKEFFTIHDMAASGRPKMAAVEHIGYNYAMFGFAQSGPYWREMRKIATLELLSNRRVQLLKGIRVSEVATFLKELYTTWSASTTGDVDDHNHGVLVELKQWFGDLTLNVILSMVAGKRYSFDGGGADEDEKREADCVQDAVRKFFYFAGVFVVGDVVPYLRWLDIGGHEKAMKKTAKEIDAILGEWLQEHKQRRRAGETGEHDFMDAMLTVLENADLEGYDADTVNKATCLNMILGGSDTTMVTLTWAISLLLNNRHVLKQAQDELDTKVGRDRIVSESDTGELVYLNAIVKETLRLYPVVPLSAQHEFTEDCIVNGYHVEKGTRLITNLWKIQTNPRVWPDPLEFKPERFLTTHKNVDLRGNHFDLIPFGSGRRACPGSSFALQMVQFTLASFLHAFEISTPSDALVDMSESFGLTNVKATPLEVLIKPRSRTKLYL